MLPHLFALALALALAPLASAQRGATCPNTLSCHVPASPPVNTCCTEAPSGLVVLTQFWDSKGPAQSWTIHGLWPDLCDGRFVSGCDSAREYPSPAALLAAAGESSTLAFMREQWKGLRGDEQLWKHEWNNHGTCMSTLRPECFDVGTYKKGDEAVEYFVQTVRMHKQRDTYAWLSKCGITPSASKTYTRAQIESCLEDGFGATPYIGCKGNVISEMWYYHYVRGPVYGGVYEPTASTAKSKCPAAGIKYNPKSRV